jgi:hypothetical protein
MWDKHVDARTIFPKTLEITSKEIRAPTDESIRLAHEIREKALHDIMSDSALCKELRDRMLPHILVSEWGKSDGDELGQSKRTIHNEQYHYVLCLSFKLNGNLFIFKSRIDKRYFSHAPTSATNEAIDEIKKEVSKFFYDIFAKDIGFSIPATPKPKGDTER